MVSDRSRAIADCVSDIKHNISLSHESPEWHHRREVLVLGQPSARRGRHPTRGTWVRYGGTGSDSATHNNLTRVNNVLTVCPMPSCRALVRYIDAKKAATRALRSHFVVGDGCLGRLHRGVCKDPSRFVQHQWNRIVDVVEGDKVIAALPLRVDTVASYTLTPHGASVALRAAADAMALELPHAHAVCNHLP